MQGGDQGVAAGVCVAAQPEGGSQAEDVDSGIVADTRGRGDQLVKADDGVVELPGLPPPHGQTAFLHPSNRLALQIGRARQIGAPTQGGGTGFKAGGGGGEGGGLRGQIGSFGEGSDWCVHQSCERRQHNTLCVVATTRQLADNSQRPCL